MSVKLHINNADRQREYRLRQKEKGIKDLRIRDREYSYSPRSDKELLPFVGWDGEGRDINGKHCYTLLHNSRGKYAYNSAGLSTLECLKFLLEESKDDKAIHVSFVFSYDVNMILGDLKEDYLRQLNGQFYDDKMDMRLHIDDESEERGGWQKTGKEECEWFDHAEQKWYYLEYRPRKYFKVSRSMGSKKWNENTPNKFSRDIECSIKIWDVFGFFQQSYIRAIDEYFPDKDTLPGYDTIVYQKQNRGSFTEDTDEDVRYYCELECEYLVLMMDKLRGYLRECGIYNARWDGTGAVASYVMQKNKVKDFMKPTPEHLKDAIGRAYAGGRIEMTCIGRAQGKFYDYDLTSAYPSIQRDLPCLAHSTFVPGGKKPGKISLVHIKWQFEDDLGFYPLFFRGDNGAISFKQRGEGWYWQDEYLAALAFLEKTKGTLGPMYEYVRVKECYNLETACPDTCSGKPFAFLQVQFDQRMEMKKAKNAAQLALKLSINSCYGKTMQQIGGTPERPPPYFQIEWGGMITSAVRAKLVMAALTTSPENIISFATDGILSKAPLDIDIKEHGELGTWELKGVYEEVVIVLPGIYWYRQGANWVGAMRGFSRNSDGEPTDVLEGWAQNKRELPYPQTRFISLRQALAGNSISKLWRTWITDDRQLSLVGGGAKRQELPTDFDTRTLGFSLQLLNCRTKRSLSGVSGPFPVDFWATKDGEERAIDEEESEMSCE